MLTSAVERPVEVRAYAERIEFRQNGSIVGEHRRKFGRGRMLFDPRYNMPCWRARCPQACHDARERGPAAAQAAEQRDNLALNARSLA